MRGDQGISEALPVQIRCNTFCASHIAAHRALALGVLVSVVCCLQRVRMSLRLSRAGTDKDAEEEVHSQL
jgi:hypothetical protein